MATLYASVAASATWGVSRGDSSCRSRSPVVRRLSPGLNSARNGFLKRRGKVTTGASADEEASEKNVPLWRKELPSVGDPSGDPSGDGAWLPSASMEEDLARLQQKRELEKRVERFNSRRQEPESAGGEEGGGLAKSVVEKVLVADFFFILFILAWLVAGLVERSLLASTALIDSWLPLWASVFQPALGVFMAGAIVSAAAGYLAKRESK